MTDSTVVRIEALWYRLSGIHSAGCAQHSWYGSAMHCCICAASLSKLCMSRPYPVGEKVAVIITMLAGCTKAVRTGKSGTTANACALHDGLSKDPRRRVGL